VKLHPVVHKWFNNAVVTDKTCLTPTPVEVYILRFPTDNERKSAKKRGAKTICFMACEPMAYKDIFICEKGESREVILSANYIDFIKSNHHKVDYIFDYDERIVGKIPNCIHTLSAYSFIDKKTSSKYKQSEKKFDVSFICTNKTDSKNQLLRQIIWNDQNKISIPRAFFNSSRLPMENDMGMPQIGKEDNGKSELFKSMFSIIVENSIERDYFSEKIVDCFATKTIPIYLGCPNISEYFDTAGIITVRDEDEIFRICNSLTADVYNKRIASINTNYILAQPYLVTLTERVLEAVKQNLFPCFAFDAF